VLLLQLAETMAAAETGLQTRVKMHKTLLKLSSEMSGMCVLSGAGERLLRSGWLRGGGSWDPAGPGEEMPIRNINKC